MSFQDKYQHVKRCLFIKLSVKLTYKLNSVTWGNSMTLRSRIKKNTITKQNDPQKTSQNEMNENPQTPRFSFMFYKLFLTDDVFFWRSN